MSLSQSDQRDIVRADNERRLARDIDDYLAIHGRPTDQTRVKPGTMLVSADAKAVGAVTALTHRASKSSWLDRNGQLRGRVRGYAGSVENGVVTDEPDTVLVHKDGKTEIRTVASFRSKSEATRATRSAPTAAQRTPEMAAAKYPTHILTGD